MRVREQTSLIFAALPFKQCYRVWQCGVEEVGVATDQGEVGHLDLLSEEKVGKAADAHTWQVNSTIIQLGIFPLKGCGFAWSPGEQ